MQRSSRAMVQEEMRDIFCDTAPIYVIHSVLESAE